MATSKTDSTNAKQLVEQVFAEAQDQIQKIDLLIAYVALAASDSQAKALKEWADDQRRVVPPPEEEHFENIH